MHLHEEKISSQTIYEGKIFNVLKDTVRLENNTEAIREYLTHPGGVCVAAITDNNEILLVRQYRYAQQRIMLEIPAGKLDIGEDHFECGKRELLEETGYAAKDYRYLGEFFPTPAYVTEITHMYFAKNLELKSQKLDEDEFLDVVKIPIDDAVNMIMKNEIKDGKTQTAVLLAKMILDKE